MYASLSLSTLLLSMVCSMAYAQADESSASLLRRAKVQQREGRIEEAIRLASQAIEADGKNASAYLLRGRLHGDRREYAESLGDLDRAISLDPEGPEAYFWRGRHRFCQGNVTGANDDFERYLRLRPNDRPYRWEYGISLYYAGRYQEGADLFTDHQTVNSNDVENAAWRYLCMARANGLPTARDELLPIEGDTRVPMKEIHLLYAGKAKPADVLQAARMNDPTPKQLKMHEFYAHLYLGLYFEAAGDVEQAEKHLAEADSRQISHYMWDVAHVHAARLKTSKQ